MKFLFVLLVAANLCWGQSGNYFLSHYAPADERFDYFTFAMVQDDKGVLYFANKRGIIEFDGRNWGLIATSGPVYTVTVSGHEIYAGGFNGFGKITNGSDNKNYQSLSQSQSDATQIFSSLSLKGKVFFANSKSIFVLNSATNSIDATIKAKPDEEFNGLVEINGKPYIKSTAGIFLVEDNKLVPPSFPWTDNLSIDFATSSTSANPLTLLAVDGGRFFLASTSGLREISLADKDFINQNTAVAAAWLSDNLVAIGTLRGGVIFIDPQTGATKEISNFYTGLPDNEVFTVLSDDNGGLWVAHSYGFTRVAPFVPFRSFNHYSGIQGNLLCARTFQGQSYVGTTLGLFTLVKRDVVEETKAGAAKIPAAKDPKRRGGLFSFLKRDKAAQPSNQVTEPKRTIKTSEFVFKKVGGVEGKVTHLIEADNQLLAAGNFGVASVKGEKTEAVTSIPVRAIYKSKTLGQLFVSTFEDDIRTLRFEKSWKETNLLDTLNEFVSYIFEDKLQNIWLCGRTNAIKVETVDGQITSVEQVPFSNPTIDESVGLAFGSEVYIASGGSFHRYDIKDNVFKSYDSLPGPKKYFASAGYFWFHDGHRWRTVDPRVQAALRLEWLGLFTNIRYIAQADNESLWVITANNELFKFSSKQADQSIKDYPLFLREVRGQQNKFAPSKSIVVSQLESTVSFDFIQPDYLGMKAVEYRYQVKGRNSEWTPWATTNNIVNFSYLPSGVYRLDVQTRDLMGKISAVEEITLEVEPPYWRRSWFYLLEVIFFGSMVFLSIKLGAGTKYKLISQVLSMLTIIMIIQLVQAAVTTQVTFKASPVIDFFVQVVLALLVLPIERYLRRLMIASL